MSIAELIEKEKLNKMQEKKALKDSQMKVAKATKPAKAMLKSLLTIKANLKVDKLPPAMALSNPLEDSITAVTTAIDALEHSCSDAMVKQLNEEVVKANHVAKSMRVFT